MYKVVTLCIIFILFLNTGQTVDAIATPFVGIIVDKFGKKKNWVLLGKYDFT
jgi:hypothetical protein